MTDLDSPRRNNDCYFYYYSTCAKGDSCTFRHEPSALGCETMCSFWKEGKCLNVHCNFRHMELRKNRKAIQCYWETQPGGCLKPHCPFLHQNVNQSMNDYAVNKIGPNTDTTKAGKQNDIGQAPEKSMKNPVDSLVVNFEEESDSESAPSFSPVKKQIKKVKVKTLEEIRLEKIQEESAAYFSYYGADAVATLVRENDLRHRLLDRMRQKRPAVEDSVPNAAAPKKKKLNFIENATLDDHIQTLTHKPEVTPLPKSAENISLDEHISQKRKQKFPPHKRKDEPTVSYIKIKTLSELRAERMKKQEQTEPDSQCNNTNIKRKCRTTESDDEVSSTSKDDTEIKEVKKEQPRKRLKLKRLPSTEFKDLQTEVDLDTKIENNNLDLTNEKQGNSDENQILLNSDVEVEVPQNVTSPPNIPDNDQNESRLQESESIKLDSKTSRKGDIIESENVSETNSIGSNPFSNKLAEEVLLLDDDDDYTNVTLKDEDELLGEIDDL